MKNVHTVPSYVPFIGRLLLAAIFLISGAGKIAAPGATIGYISSIGLPFPEIGFALAVAVEIAGGLLLAFGFYTRAAALILAAFSVAAGIIFHSAIGDQNQMIHLLKNLAMAGGLLQVFTFGAGAFSMDRRWASKSAWPNTSVQA